MYEANEGKQLLPADPEQLIICLENYVISLTRENQRLRRGLPTVNREAVKWSQAEKDFLAAVYREKPRISNRRLAYLCSKKFGRDINDNCIRGMLDRLRKRGLIERYRPQGPVRKSRRRRGPSKKTMLRLETLVDTQIGAD